MLQTDENDIIQRRDLLVAEMEMLINADNASARNFERRIDWLYWVGVSCSALATLLGLVHSHYVEGWMVSVLAGLATITAVVRRDSNLRTKSNWFYERRDVTDRLRRKLLYEGPLPLTAKYVSEVSQELSKRRSELGVRMSDIHKKTDGSQALVM